MLKVLVNGAGNVRWVAAQGFAHIADARINLVAARDEGLLVHSQIPGVTCGQDFHQAHLVKEMLSDGRVKE